MSWSECASEPVRLLSTTHFDGAEPVRSGYLPHSGIGSIQDFITATNEGVGMSLDLAGFLAVYGAVVDGDGSSWSIGGQPHTGILGSHHNYEADSSPLKSDLNQYGSNGRLIMAQFQEVSKTMCPVSRQRY